MVSKYKKRHKNFDNVHMSFIKNDYISNRVVRSLFRNGKYMLEKIRGHLLAYINITLRLQGVGNQDFGSK